MAAQIKSREIRFKGNAKQVVVTTVTNPGGAETRSYTKEDLESELAKVSHPAVWAAPNASKPGLKQG